MVERLKQESPLTWLDIVRALRSDTLRKNRLASQIEDRYIRPLQATPLENDKSVSSSAHQIAPAYVSSGQMLPSCAPLNHSAGNYPEAASPQVFSTIASSTSNTTQSNVGSQATVENVASSVTEPSPTNTTQSPAVSQGRVEQIKTSIDHFECEFSDLKSTARKELSDKESQDSKFLGRFCDHLVDLPLSKKTLHNKFFHENKNDIVNAKSIQEQFFILSGYCDYTNYGIIHHIIKRFCGELLKRRMEAYQETLTKFEKDTPVDIYLCAMSSNNPNSVIHQKFDRMVLKINKPASVCTLHEIRELTEAMGENASLYPYCMYIGAVSSNCVYVVLYIPPGCTRDVVGALTPDFLLVHKLMEVSVNGQDITYHWVRNQSPGKQLHSNSPPMLPTASVSQDDITREAESQWMTQPQPLYILSSSGGALLSPGGGNTAPLSSPAERHQLSSVPQHQGTQLSSVPQQKRPRLSSVPQEEETQLSSVSQQKTHQVFSVPQHQGTQLSSVSQRKRPKLSSVPQKEETQLTSVSQKEGTQLSSLPQQGRAELFATYTSAMPLSLLANLVPPQLSFDYSMRQPPQLPHYYSTPLLTDDSSVSRQPTPTHTSVTPPLQSHSQSSGSDHPQTTTAVSESLVHHQSKIVEDVINRHTSRLTEAFSNDLHYFSNKFTELGFIRRKAASDIHSIVGVGSEGRGDKLLDLVIASFHTSHDPRKWFGEFVSIFSHEAAYVNLATSMTEYHTRHYKDDGSYTAYLSHPSSSPSLQSHSHTTDRPSLSSEVGRSHVMSHNEPQSVHTQPQASSHTLSSSHMQQYIQYVKTVYRGSVVERDQKVVKLQNMPTKVYINLVCIDRKTVDNSREYDEVTKAMVQEGSLDVVYGKKWPIDFNEIAANLPATSESFDRVVLVEGAPGVGKSTFAWEFCRRWERGEIAQQYQLVLLLRLREERISNARCLEDLIYHPSEDVCLTVTKELKRNLGVNTLIILEGFDELPDRCRTDGSIFMDLIAGKSLPLATVLVTSRPWATRKMLQNHDNRIYQHIEILGFKDHQITEYIESTLPQDKASDLKAYLESHPQIRAGMYIPLNSASVVTVYKESQSSGCAMPTTLTELYTSLARTLLRRYLRGHPEYGTDGTIFLQTFKDLPRPVYAKFCEVCKLAYNGTVGTKWEVKLIYRKSDMPSNFDDLGFMDSVIELYETRPEATSYNFLHLTFQEFFAAVHISSMSSEEQVKHFKQHKEGRLKVVLRFVAGLNTLDCFSIEERADSFFQTPSTCEGSRYLISCDAAVGIDLVQWLFEAQSDDVFEHVLGQKTIEFNLSSGMLPLDYYSLGYSISHSQCQWVLGLGKKIDEDEVRMLAAGAGTRSEPRGRVIELRRMQTERSNYKSQLKEKSFLSLSGKCLSVLFTEWKSILCLHQLSLELPVRCDQITWPDFSELRVLELETGGYTKWKLETLLPGLSLESLTVLHCHDEEFVAIGNHITSTTSLKELCISSDIISIEKEVEAITAALASNQSLPLQRVKLECHCTFTATAVDSLAQFITNTITLKYLSIKECTFSAHALLVLARAMHRNSILQTKNVEEFSLTVNGDSEVKDLVQLLVKYPDLMNRISPYESIKCNEISDAEAVSLAQVIQHNFIPLKRLDLSNNSISDAGAVALAQVLHHNSTLTELVLSNNSISDAGAVALAQALHHNSTLTELYLSENSSSDAGAVALAQALHHNSTLTELGLCGNDGIGEEGTRQLIQALTVNTSISGWPFGGLRLPEWCEEYARQCPQYDTVRNRIRFSDLW